MKRLFTAYHNICLWLFCSLISSVAGASELDEVKDKTESFLETIIDILLALAAGIFTIAFIVCGIMFLRGKWPKEYMINCIAGLFVVGMAKLLATGIFAAFT